MIALTVNSPIRSVTMLLQTHLWIGLIKEKYISTSMLPTGKTKRLENVSAVLKKRRVKHAVSNWTLLIMNHECCRQSDLHLISIP